MLLLEMDLKGMDKNIYLNYKDVQIRMELDSIDFKHKTVTISFDAPKDVVIDRGSVRRARNNQLKKIINQANSVNKD